MNLKFSAFCICFLFQHLQISQRHGILRICLILCPCKHNLSGPYKSAHVIHMLIGFILIDSTWKPDNLVDTEPVLQLFLYLFPAHLRITSLTQQTGLCNDQSPLSVRMDGTTLKHKRSGIQTWTTKSPADKGSHPVVLLPVPVKSIKVSSPGIKLPVNSTDRPFLIQNHGCSHISRPGIICLAFQQSHTGNIPKLILCILHLSFGNQHIHLFALSNSLCNFHKCFLCFPCPIIPGTGTFRPDHHTSLMRLKFSGHTIFCSVLLCNFHVCLLFFDSPADIRKAGS